MYFYLVFLSVRENSLNYLTILGFRRLTQKNEDVAPTAVRPRSRTYRWGSSSISFGSSALVSLFMIGDLLSAGESLFGIGEFLVLVSLFWIGDSFSAGESLQHWSGSSDWKVSLGLISVIMFGDSLVLMSLFSTGGVIFSADKSIGIGVSLQHCWVSLGLVSLFSAGESLYRWWVTTSRDSFSTGVFSYSDAFHLQFKASRSWASLGLKLIVWSALVSLSYSDKPL